MFPYILFASVVITTLYICRKNIGGLVVALACLLASGIPTHAASPSPTRLPVKSSFQLAFSPHGESLELVLSCIQDARHSIQVAAYSFTSKPVALALAEAHQRGVNVQVVADRKGNGSKYTAVTFLANRGVPVRLNGNYAIHHHKFLVIDGKHIQTGSFNYSEAAATKNAENVLVLRDAPGTAAQYAAEWQRLWDEADPLHARY